MISAKHRRRAGWRGRRRVPFFWGGAIVAIGVAVAMIGWIVTESSGALRGPERPARSVEHPREETPAPAEARAGSAAPTLPSRPTGPGRTPRPAPASSGGNREPEPVAPTGSGAIHGAVVDERGVTVAGGTAFLVRAGRRERDVEIDAAGRFRFDRCRAGDVTVVVLPARHAPARERLHLASGAARSLRLRVLRGESLPLRAVDVEGRGVAGVAFTVVGAAWSLVRRGTADAAGRWTAEGLPRGASGTVRVVARKPGWFARVGASGRSIVRGPAGRYTVRMVRAGSLAGRVVDVDGRPVRGALVHVDFGAWGWSLLDGPSSSKRIEGVNVCPSLATRTDAEGRYAIRDFPPLERVPVAVRVAGRPPATRYVRLAPGETRADADYRLGVGAMIRGIVLDPLGKPVAGAAVIVACAGRVATTLAAGADGRFEVSGLGPGRIAMRAEDDAGRVSAVWGGEVVAPGSRAVALRLRPTPPPISGRVFDASGVPIRHAEVVGEPASTPGLFAGESFFPVTARTAPDGTFRLTDLRLGWRYRITVAHASGRARAGPIASGCTGIVLRLAPPTGAVRVHLPHGVAGDDVQVVVVPEGGEARTAPGDVRGTSIEGLVPGRVVVRAVDLTGGVVAGPARADVVAGQTIDVRLDARHSRDLIGRVVDRRGRPVSGAEVSTLVTTAGDVKRRATRTDAEGRFRLRAVGSPAAGPGSPFDCAVSVPDVGFTVVSGVRPAGGPVELRFAPTHRLRVTVRDAASDRAIDGATVGLLSPGRAAFRSTTGRGGRADLRVSAGSFALVAAADGYEPNGQRISIETADRVVDVRVALAPRSR